MPCCGGAGAMCCWTYLAVCEGKRGRGTGSEMLALLSERYAGFAGILAEAEAEEEDAPPEVNALRARRLSFYRRGGFTVLDYEADIFSVRYAMLLRTPGGPADSAAAMEAHRALYRSRLPAPLYRRFVHIPIQERRDQSMNILAIESSCDETAAAVVRDGRIVLSDAIASQADMHAIYGGVVPEIASRKHVEAIAALTDQALEEAGVGREDLDAVAVTYAPGLIGAVLVGVNYAKSVAFALNKPLIPVHHVRGHIAANYITHPDLEPPFVCLCVSGGNTMIVDVKSYTEMEILGATRDDAAGECFDKAARVLGIGYPGGAPMDRLAQGGDDENAMSCPGPMLPMRRWICPFQGSRRRW